MQGLYKKSLLGLLAAILGLACLGFATSNRETSVTFSQTAKFQNGATLPAGTYRMKVPENSQTPMVSFSKYGKVVATASAKLITEPKKNSMTEIDSVKRGNAQLVTRIRPSGWDQDVLFGNTNQSGSASAASSGR
jgi:hypothetical protein